MSAFRSFVNVVGRTGRALTYTLYFYIYTHKRGRIINEYISGLVCNLIMKFRLSAPANMAATRVLVFAPLQCSRNNAHRTLYIMHTVFVCVCACSIHAQPYVVFLYILCF